MSQDDLSGSCFCQLIKVLCEHLDLSLELVSEKVKLAYNFRVVLHECLAGVFQFTHSVEFRCVV